MSRKQKRSSRSVKAATARTAKRLDRPFDPNVLAQAKQIVRDYRFVIERRPDVGYMGCPVELPEVYGDGETIAECVADTIEAAEGAVAFMLEEKMQPPRHDARDRQMNVKLTGFEKLLLEERARQAGCNGLSDYVRRKALA